MTLSSMAIFPMTAGIEDIDISIPIALSNASIGKLCWGNDSSLCRNKITLALLPFLVWPSIALYGHPPNYFDGYHDQGRVLDEHDGRVPFCDDPSLSDKYDRRVPFYDDPSLWLKLVSSPLQCDQGKACVWLNCFLLLPFWPATFSNSYLSCPLSSFVWVPLVVLEVVWSWDASLCTLTNLLMWVHSAAIQALPLTSFVVLWALLDLSNLSQPWHFQMHSTLMKFLFQPSSFLLTPFWKRCMPKKWL